MNKIIFLIAIFACMSMVYAEHNPTVTSNTVNLSTKVITPFTVVDATPNGTPSLPNVIKGQTRDLTTAEGRILLFKMNRDVSHTVKVTLSCPEPVDGVDLTASWYWFDTPPDWSGNLSPLGSTWYWVDSQTTCWLSIDVTKITAAATAAPGKRTFTAKVVGQYNGF